MPDYNVQTNANYYPCANMNDPQVVPFRQFGMMPFGFGGQQFQFHHFHHHFHHHFFHHHFPFGF